MISWTPKSFAITDDDRFRANRPHITCAAYTDADQRVKRIDSAKLQWRLGEGFEIAQRMLITFRLSLRRLDYCVSKDRGQIAGTVDRLSSIVLIEYISFPRGETLSRVNLFPTPRLN